jgi:hypothetical protein
MSTKIQRTCPSCGSELSGAAEFCPVCLLRKGLADGVESGESSFEEAVKPTLDRPPKRFEHYELVTGEDGKPVELSRGAMGVAYKAFDVNLGCPVTLKVISERYLVLCWRILASKNSKPLSIWRILPAPHWWLKIRVATHCPGGIRRGPNAGAIRDNMSRGPS